MPRGSACRACGAVRARLSRDGVCSSCVSGGEGSSAVARGGRSRGARSPSRAGGSEAASLDPFPLSAGTEAILSSVRDATRRALQDGAQPPSLSPQPRISGGEPPGPRGSGTPSAVEGSSGSEGSFSEDFSLLLQKLAKYKKSRLKAGKASGGKEDRSRPQKRAVRTREARGGPREKRRPRGEPQDSETSSTASSDEDAMPGAPEGQEGPDDDGQAQPGAGKGPQAAEGDDPKVVRLFRREELYPLIPTILDEIGVDPPPVESRQGVKMDPVLLGLAGPALAFPFHFSVSDILFREWDTPELGLKVSKAMDKLYPLPEDALELLRLPRVDAAVSAVTKRSTIPVTGATALRDIQDRKLEVQLKKIFEVSALGVRAAMCSTFALRAGLRWAQVLQANADLSSGEATQADNLEAVIAYSADAMHDVLRTSARAMVAAVSARRLLWLRNWAADGASKAHLGSLPFKGKLLFGKQLDDLMQFVSENKAFKLPEDRPRPRSSFSARNRFRSNRRQRPQRATGSGQSYRSGSARSSSWSQSFRGKKFNRAGGPSSGSGSKSAQ
ncbi:uncharacterized protein LOC115097441 [Rhinatrema bivittatum]|uniref:uncharacterized protein LOC115097441 n=1 Tax=Rhinatrema bivittatum TaxID=194408 RepID=UPI00112C0B8F|nr:uncharacterized protein LOC115097441 [Rhinatrema bivittatum]